MKAVQLLVNSKLPPDLRDYTRALDGKSLSVLLADVARRYPDKYEEIAHELSSIGRKASYYMGITLSSEDTSPVVDRDSILAEMDAELDNLKKTAPQKFDKEKYNIWNRYADRLQKDTVSGALQRGTNLGYSIVSGARGKPAQLQAMVTTPALYADAQDRTIPLFIRNSFADGLRPAEYLAGSYGARKSVIATKVATAAGGYLGKLMVQSTTPLVVTTQDCGVRNGIDLPIDDKSVKGRLLARETDGIPAGTIIDKNVLAALKKKGLDTVIARSALTCQAKSGVCAKCLGLKPDGKFNSVGETAGITASQALSEPICLEENTLVRMADWSTKKIKDIKAGEYVLGSDMSGNLTPTRVVNVFHNGPRECVRTRIRKGGGQHSDIIELISTKEHKVLSGSGKNYHIPVIQPIDIAGQSQKVVYLSKGVKKERGRKEKWAALLGLLVGDGCYSSTSKKSRRSITLSCFDPDTVAWTSRFLNNHGMMLTHTPSKDETKPSGAYRIIMRERNSYRTYDGGVLVKNKLKHILKREQMWGQKGENKRLPHNIHSWNNASVAAFIGGFLAADGSVTKTDNTISIRFYNNSRKVIEDIKFLLEVRFGIYSSKIKEYNKIKDANNNTFYTTNYFITISSLCDIEHFARIIPIVGIKKQRLQDYLQECKHLSRKNYRKRGRYRIVSQEPVGVKDTWDIEVDNATHLFALHNSMIVSNTQGALSTKHTAGQAGSKKEYSGFSYINQFVQSPENYPDRAAVSQADGFVTKIEEAPQGGHYVYIDDTPHYVPEGYPIIVKKGDTVEAGDQLSEGLVDAAEIVDLRGLGEGRKYYVERLKKLLEDSSLPADRRNLELFARGALDHVQIEDADEDSSYLPDDVISYADIVNNHVPPKDTIKTDPTKAVGKYLQYPALHYTIGTRITPKISQHLAKTGMTEIYASSTSPKFKPHMVRLAAAMHNNDDWLASMHTSHLSKQLQEGAFRGSDTDIKENIHFVPRLSVGVGFGDKIQETGQF